MLPLLGENFIPIREAVSSIFRQKPEPGLDNISFDGAVLGAKIRKDLSQVMAVKNSPGDVLGPGVFAPLQNDGLDPLLGQNAGCRDSGRPGSDNDHIKALFHPVSFLKN
jgi:hypothetical protein